ncbi:hypothetical protein PIB30_042360 [Stylosanthes scabra]|uniref:Uncharacterized protein n=1 Tax=Stylosanthes scabra TaxID=79078 RepID=A0ABU6UDT9_9FABA|nr:hypothetical protein [Stylosanthes scabra]
MNKKVSSGFIAWLGDRDCDYWVGAAAEGSSRDLYFGIRISSLKNKFRRWVKVNGMIIESNFVKEVWFMALGEEVNEILEVEEREGCIALSPANRDFKEWKLDVMKLQNDTALWTLNVNKKWGTEEGI